METKLFTDDNYNVPDSEPIVPIEEGTPGEEEQTEQEEPAQTDTPTEGVTVAAPMEESTPKAPDFPPTVPMPGPSPVKKPKPEKPKPEKPSNRKIVSLALSNQEYEYLQTIFQAREQSGLSNNWNHFLRQCLNYAVNYQSGWKFGVPAKLEKVYFEV